MCVYVCVEEHLKKEKKKRLCGCVGLDVSESACTTATV